MQQQYTVILNRKICAIADDANASYQFNLPWTIKNAQRVYIRNVSIKQDWNGTLQYLGLVIQSLPGNYIIGDYSPVPKLPSIMVPLSAAPVTAQNYVSWEEKYPMQYSTIVSQPDVGQIKLSFTDNTYQPFTQVGSYTIDFTITLSYVCHS